MHSEHLVLLAEALPAALLCFFLFTSALLWKAALAACQLSTILPLDKICRYLFRTVSLQTQELHNL